MATPISPAEHLELLLGAMEDTLLAVTLIQLGYKEISPTKNPEWKQAFKADFEAKQKQLKSMKLLDLVREAGHKGINLLPSVTNPTAIEAQRNLK
eukprot:GAHX01002587.1.p1 GENE.GAHX01002587.1~~GAHX01002587.1.p1  ORF type:complete len:95 (+),score=11.96 GAHX01002587.1:60-344(+)